MRPTRFAFVKSGPMNGRIPFGDLVKSTFDYALPQITEFFIEDTPLSSKGFKLERSKPSRISGAEGFTPAGKMSFSAHQTAPISTHTQCFENCVTCIRIESSLKLRE